MSAAKEWVATGAKSGMHIDVVADPDHLSGDPTMARNLNQWFAALDLTEGVHAQLFLTPLSAGKVRARLVSEHRSCRQFVTLSPEAHASDNEAAIRSLAGYFLAKEADDLRRRRQYMTERYDLTSRRSVLPEIDRAADAALICADILLGAADPLAKLTDDSFASRVCAEGFNVYAGNRPHKAPAEFWQPSTLNCGHIDR